jgi:hypothetical protein
MHHVCKLHHDSAGVSPGFSYFLRYFLVSLVVPACYNPLRIPVKPLAEHAMGA